MVAKQKRKKPEQDSRRLLTRNLLRMALFNISYIRGVFPEKYFSDKGVPAFEMRIKKLMPMDAESRRLIHWMKKGVYDALQKKYLRTLMISVCETVDGPMIEEYSFSLSYSNSDSQEVCMNVNRVGNKKQGEAFKSNSTTEIIPTQMKSSACKMVRTLIQFQLMRTLDKMPEELADYEPPFFRGCTVEEARHAWTKNPLTMEVGNVNSKQFVLSQKVKSVREDDNVSLGGDSMQEDGDRDADGEASISDDECIVAPIDKQKEKQGDTMADEDDTQDPAEDEQQLNRVMDWYKSYRQENVDVTDVRSNFPDISSVLLEGVTEGILVKTRNESFTITKPRNSEYGFDAVKEEADACVAPGKKSLPTTSEDHIYMKALYHKLQSKLGGEANQVIVRTLMDKMTKESYTESSYNCRLDEEEVFADDDEDDTTDDEEDSIDEEENARDEEDSIDEEENARDEEDARDEKDARDEEDEDSDSDSSEEDNNSRRETCRTFKMVIVGEKGCGKTTFVKRYYEPHAKSGAEVYNMDTHGNVKLHTMEFLGEGDSYLFDCVDVSAEVPNPERYLIGAHCAIIMFDVTNKDSFDKCRKWLNLLKRISGNPDMPIVICGNKVDLINSRVVEPVQLADSMSRLIISCGSEYSRTSSCTYYEVSALGNYQWERPFVFCIRKLMNRPFKLLDLDWIGFRRQLVPPEVNVDHDEQKRIERIVYERMYRRLRSRFCIFCY